MHAPTPDMPDYLALDDQQLLAQCDLNITRSSGPGGQHRNKVSSAVRLRHQPTGITAHGDESRSQHDNRRVAIKRLRASIACQLRRPINLSALTPPPVVTACLHYSRKAEFGDRQRLTVGARDARYWPIVQFLLDVLEACGGRISEAAEKLGITGSNLTSILQQDRHAYAAAQDLRKRHHLGPLR